MSDDVGAHRRWWRRAGTVISVGVAAAAAVAVPALAHPVFSNDAPGFPNPQGSLTVPYPAGSRPTVNMYLPFEQEGVSFNGAVNTTVDVKVTVPVGWTGPACGNASTSTGYRQVGAVVPGWTCVVETIDGHQVLHWHGPQVSRTQTEANSAQFFTFVVTVPSPATTTSYGASGSTAEGFYVEQVYASTVDFSLWRTPNSTRPGEVANGIVRTVVGAPTPPPSPTGPPPPQEQEHGGPTPSPAGQQGGAPPAAGRPGGGGSTPAQTGQPRGSTPAQTGQPASSGSPKASGSPSATAQGSSAPTTTEPSPGADSQRTSVTEQLAQQRDDTTGYGWRILVGVVLAALIVVGAVIAVVQRRRRSS